MAISTASSTLPRCRLSRNACRASSRSVRYSRSEARRQPPVQTRRRPDPLPHVTAVPLEGRRRLPGFVQTVPAEHPDRLEQPVATRAGQAHDEALVDQLTEHGDGCRVRQWRCRFLHGADVERRREDAEVPEQALLGLVEEAVAPVDGRLHRGVPLRVARRRSPTAARGDRRGAGSTRRDRTGGAGRPPTRAPAGRRRAGDRARPPPGRPDPTARGARRLGRARRTAPAPRRGAGRAARRAHRRHRAAPGWWRGSCAASPRSSIRSTSAAGALEDVLAVVEHEQDRSIRQVVGDALDRLRRRRPRPRRPRPRLSSRPPGAAPARDRRTRRRRRTPRAGARRPPTATVVLPMPPDPVIVTSASGADPLDDAGDVAVAADGCVAQSRERGPDAAGSRCAPRRRSGTRGRGPS